jgi:alpha-ketoglutarate-dependent taurine dioxygenase
MHAMTTDRRLPMWAVDDGAERLARELSTVGAVVLNGIERAEQLLELMRPLGSIEPHRDSRPDGLTHIQADATQLSRAVASSAGHLGFRQDGLFPHTDRSGLPRPPDLLAFWIETQSRVGGSALFVDGYELFERLSQTAPEDLQCLMSPGSAVFKSEGGLIESSIFSIDEGRLRVRFRFDNMVYLSPAAAKAVDKLVAAVGELTLCERLRSGQGYVVDNTRWLHGRTHFIGARSAYRLLLRSEGRAS